MTAPRTFSCLAVFLGCALAHPIASLAQGASWDAVRGAAQKEGRVVIYGQVQVPVLARIKADFEKAHPGITLEFVRMSGSPIVTKVEQERQSGADGADVLQQTEMGWYNDRAKEGVFRAPAGPAARTWPAQYMLAGVVPMLALEPFGVIVYNTNSVKAPIGGYADLLRPELKGAIGLVEPGNSPSGIAWYDWLANTQGPAFLGRLAAQSPRLYTSALPNTQAVASGEMKVTAYSILSAAKPLLAQGAPIRIVLPKPSLAIVHGAAALGWSKRPNAALVLLDYLMSARGQTIWTGQGEYASPLAGIPGSLDAREMTAYDQIRYTAEFVRSRSTELSRLLREKGSG